VPFVPGVEAVGRVVALGRGTTGFALRDRVAWVYTYGCYAEQIAVAASEAVPVPDDISDEVAASLMMQGMNAHHFVAEVAPLATGEVALVHAAAGGLGRLLTHLLRIRGVRVIGLVSRAEKVAAAKAAGADEVLISAGEGFVQRVRDLTGGAGVHAVFDGGGGSTFPASMAAARRLGIVLYYGAVIDDVPVVKLTEIPNSIRIAYPVFRDHYPTREALLAHSAELFNLVREDRIAIEIGGRYPLEAASRHTAPSRFTRLTAPGLAPVGRPARTGSDTASSAA
jgi:NADPH2:quinone reductase